MSVRVKSNPRVDVVDAPALVTEQAPSASSRPYRFPFHLVRTAVPAFDFTIIVAASIASGIGYGWYFLDGIDSAATFIALGVLVFANFSALTSAQGNYRPHSLVNLMRQLRYVTFTWWFICFVLLGVAFTLKISGNFSRGATLSFSAVGWLALLAFRAALARSLGRALKSGAFAERKVLLVTEMGQQFASQALIEMQRCGYVPAQTWEVSLSEIEAPGIKPSLQQKLDQIIAATQHQAIDHVILLIKWSRRRFIEQLVRSLRVLPIPVHLLPDSSVSDFLAGGAVNVGTTWTIELQRAPLSSFEQSYKRAFDVVGALIALTLLSPLMLLTAAAIKLDSRGPVLFKQKRNGFNGRTFTIFKFRSMHVLEDGAVIQQATRNDPRCTRLGQWLRQTSIDELPQLLNVLLGDMSLVGPRPHAVAHNSEYQKVVSNYAFRHHMKPGITGWAQINGYRGETKTIDLMEQRIEHDIWYVNHWSPWLDLRILLRTFLLVFSQPTAY
jgi:undecaprenyl-phosphate galactose phosphotransferase/putative colanic acid biosynthesis UDP-glucose lipid carrier transferase